MKEFEIMYIIKPNLEDEKYKEIVSKYEQVLTENNGSVKRSDIWGEKRLAYEINACTKGYYVLTSFTGNPNTINEIDRLMRIDETIIRHMIISKSA